MQDRQVGQQPWTPTQNNPHEESERNKHQEPPEEERPVNDQRDGDVLNAKRQGGETNGQPPAAGLRFQAGRDGEEIGRQFRQPLGDREDQKTGVPWSDRSTRSARIRCVTLNLP